MAKLSILTVVYFEFESIGQTCESITMNMTSEVEWIVLDGGSSDGTINILTQYASEIDILISEWKLKIDCVGIEPMTII